MKKTVVCPLFNPTYNGTIPGSRASRPHADGDVRAPIFLSRFDMI